jgi:ABC-type multidrug transport system ATPase subunit
MSGGILVEVRGAAPVAEAARFDLAITSGRCCLLGSDEPLTIEYLRMLAGVVPAHCGEITLLGEVPPDEPCGGAALRRRVGYVTPRAPLLSVLDGVRNVVLPALYHKVAPEAQVDKLCQELLDEMGEAGDHRLLPAFMPELQRRMLLIARALILQPQLLFIEQPLLGLDSVPRDKLRDYICGPVAQRVRALVIASNDPLLAGGAEHLVFVSRQGVKAYDGWQALLASGETGVQEFLEQERRVCSVLQD